MSRHGWLRRSGAIVATVTAATVATSCGTNDSSERQTAPSDLQGSAPNVVLILLDDLDATTTPAWDALPQTEALLADRGLTFTDAFASNPVCCPSRATILTGDYPHNTGIWNQSPPDGGFARFVANGGEADTIATRLQDAGYHTGMLGKYLNGYDSDPTHVAPGWDEWFSVLNNAYTGFEWDANHNGASVSFGSDAADYQTDVLAGLAVDFVATAEAEDDQPFFLQLAPTAPHWPIPPAPRHEDHPWVADPVPQRPNYDEDDVSDKPTWLREGVELLRQSWKRNLHNVADHRNRMGSLLAVDEMIAALVVELDQRDELDETFIVFTSDNGYNLGAHRLIAKTVPYEESIRVPLVVMGPGVPVGSEDRFVLLNDLAPTILDLAGAPHADADGRSLVPLLAGGDVSTWRSDFLIEYRGTGNPRALTLDDVLTYIEAGRRPPVPTYRALRTPDRLYVEWYADPAHEYELYDLVADPYQLDNLVATPEGAEQHLAETTALQARLEELAACSGPTCRE